ncbi:Uncharacterised protein [Mycobacteroides abscessus subsp. abscessus]|nr:Uncharacterised protein [Mycobacteroides abscessus subsp. abscessus]
MAAVDHPAVGHGDPHAGVRSRNRVGPGVLDERHTALGQRVFQDQGSILVLVRQHAIAAGHDGDLNPKLGVGVHELGARDTRAHHDEMFGQFIQVVELAPGENALTIGAGVGQHTWTGTCGDEHHIGLQDGAGAIRRGCLDPVKCHPDHVIDQFRAPGDQVYPGAAQPLGDIRGLLGGEALDATVDLRQRNLGVLHIDVKAQVGRAPQVGAHTRRGDERLGRHAVEQHARATDPVRVDHRHLGGASLMSRGHECRLVSRWSSANDHDARSHANNLQALPGPGSPSREQVLSPSGSSPRIDDH